MRLRPFDPGDLPSLHASVRRIEQADAYPYVTTRTEVQEWFEPPWFDDERDIVVVEVDGDVVGHGRIWQRPSGQRLERAYLFGGIDPEHRRRGIGRELLAWQLERAREKLAATPAELPAHIRVEAYDWCGDQLALHAAAGFEPVRWAKELSRDLDDVEGPPPPDPDGVRIVAWAADHDEPARLVANSAFADHWGSTPTDAASWEVELQGHGTRLDLSWVALDGDVVVAYALNEHYPDDEAVLGHRAGWIGSLGTLAEHRGRGIATALIEHSLRSFADAGFTKAMLGVDTDNPSGAHLLYERLGFRPVSTLVTSEIIVRGPARTVVEGQPT